MPGIVYFIQPAEYIGTKIYKIGCSRDAHEWTRLKSYGVGSRRICVIECSDPFGVESRIKEAFHEKYYLARGREYFSGDESSMRKTFTDTVHGTSVEAITKNFTDLTFDSNSDSFGDSDSNDSDSNDSNSDDSNEYIETIQTLGYYYRTNAH